jgi:hypothetical protein
MLGGGDMIATMGCMGTLTHALASLPGPSPVPSRGAIGVEGNGSVAPGSATSRDWTPCPSRDPTSPRSGAEAWLLDRPPGAAASPPEEPDAGTLPVRDGAGGAG